MLESLGAYRGFWLQTDSIEAFIATEPKFRVLTLNRPGEISLLGDDDNPEQGIRLAFMEPEQVPPSFDVGNVPARVLRRSADTAQVQLQAAGGLQYTVEVKLHADKPAADLSYTLANVGDAPRTIAPWSVFAFPRNGRVVVPFAEEPRSRRQLVLSWYTAWPQPGVLVGRDTLLVDATVPIAGTAYKLGVITDTGWAAFAKDDQVLHSHAPFDPKASYPEDGANITVFEAVGQRTWCEMERMGPLVEVPAGGSTVLSETVQLLAIEQPSETNPDAYRTAIEAALK